MNKFQDIAQRLAAADVPNAGPELLRPFRFVADAQNQLVFFFKPEVFCVRDKAKRRAIIDIAMQKLDAYGITVAGCALLSGTYLDDVLLSHESWGFADWFVFCLVFQG